MAPRSRWPGFPVAVASSSPPVVDLAAARLRQSDPCALTTWENANFTAAWLASTTPAPPCC